MIKIYLHTAQNEFVSNVYIPPFNRLPKVILWGVRVFQFDSEKKEIVYKEVFAVAAFSKDQLRDQGMNIK